MVGAVKNERGAADARVAWLLSFLSDAPAPGRRRRRCPFARWGRAKTTLNLKKALLSYFLCLSSIGAASSGSPALSGKERLIGQAAFGVVESLRRRLAQPGRGEHFVSRDTVAAQVTEAEVALRRGVALRRRLGEPAGRGRGIPRDARADAVASAKIGLGGGEALRRRLGVQRKCGRGVARDAFAVLVESAEVALGLGVTLRRRLCVPRRRRL